MLANKLRGTIGLCHEEITELTDYFRIQDGRISYGQLCQVLHGEGNHSTETYITLVSTLNILY